MRIYVQSTQGFLWPLFLPYPDLLLRLLLLRLAAAGDAPTFRSRHPALFVAKDVACK